MQYSSSQEFDRDSENEGPTIYEGDDAQVSVSAASINDTDGQAELEPDLIFDVSLGFDRYTCYDPIIVNPNLKCEKLRRFDHHVNDLGSQLNVPGWTHELSYENDTNLRNYLWYGVTNGFLIVDVKCNIPSYECHIYASVTKCRAHEYVNKLIHEALKNGKFKIAHTKPHCIHGLGAVP